MIMSILDIHKLNDRDVIIISLSALKLDVSFELDVQLSSILLLIKYF